MPIVKKSKYKTPKFWYRNPHISTIYFGRFLKTTPPIYQRERLELSDGDFLDVDFILQSPKKAVILRSEEHTSELQSRGHLVCRLLLEKKKTKKKYTYII